MMSKKLYKWQTEENKSFVSSETAVLMEFLSDSDKRTSDLKL